MSDNKNIKSPYRVTTDKITSIEIKVVRDNGTEQVVAFLKPESIKDLIDNEPFFKELTENSGSNVEPRKA